MLVVIDPLSSGDRVQLLEVYARSVMLLELEQYAEWANLYGLHARVRFIHGSEQSPVEFRGRDQLLTLGQRLRRGEVGFGFGNVGPRVRVRHHLTNITLFGDGPRWALGYAFLTVATLGGAQAPRWVASGVYSDRLSKNPAGCWCFQERTFTEDPAITPTPAGNQRLAAGG
jgi:SnoaL-like domain